MTQISWENGTDGQWGTAANWSGGIIPNSATADVSIDVAGAYTISLANGAAYTVDSVTFDNGSANFDLAGTLDLSGSLASFTLNDSVFTLGSTGELVGGTLNIDGGTLLAQGGSLATSEINIYGEIALNGEALTLANTSNLAGTTVEGSNLPGSFLVVTGNSSFNFVTAQDGVTLVDAGTITNSGILALGAFEGFSSGYTTDPTSLVILTGAVFDMNGGSDDPYVPDNYIIDSGDGSVSNAGLLEVDGLGYGGGIDESDPVFVTGLIGEIYSSFDNTGTVLVAAGDSLDISGGGTIGGTFAGAGTIAIAGGNYTLDPSLVDDASDLTLDGATLAGNLTLGVAAGLSGNLGLGDIDLAGYTLSLTGSVGIGGDFSGPGVLRVDGSAGLGGGLIALGAVLEDAGTITQDGGVQLQIGTSSADTGTLKIDSGAVYDLADNTDANAGILGISISSFYGTGSSEGALILNAGLLEVTGIAYGGEAAAIYGLLKNTGTLALEGGGALTLKDDIFNDNLIAIGGGKLIAAGAIGNDAGQSGKIDIANGTLVSQSAISSGQTIALTGAANLLDFGLSGFAGTITGFAGADVIDLTGTKVNGFSYANDVLTLTAGSDASVAGSLHLTGVTGTIALENDGNGGTEILLDPPGPIFSYPTAGVTTSVWNAGSGDFGDAANWLAPSVPGASSIALITASSNITIASSASETVYQLQNADSAARLLFTGGNFTVEDGPDGNGSYSDGAVVVAAGKFDAITGFTFDNAVSLNAAGTLEVDFGTLMLDGGGVLAGSIIGAGTLALEKGNVTLAAGLALGLNLVEITGATISLGSARDIAGPLLLANGTIDLNGHALTLSGDSTLGSSANPEVNGPGSILITGIAQFDGLSLQNGANILDAGTIVQAAGLAIGNSATDTSSLIIDNGATYVLNSYISGGSEDGGVRNAGLLALNGALEVFVLNIGTIEIAAGDGGYISGPLINSGTILVDGALSFNNGDTLAGDFAGSGTLQLRGDYTLGQMTGDSVTINAYGGALTAGVDAFFGGTLIDADLLETVALNGQDLTLAGSSVLDGVISGDNGSVGNSLMITGNATLATVDGSENDFPEFTQIENEATLIVDGTVTQIYTVLLGSGGIGTYPTTDGSSIVIVKGGVYNLAGGDLVVNFGTGSISNAGLLEVTPGLGGQVVGAFMNTGTVLAASGSTLDFYDTVDNDDGNISNIADGTLSGGTWEVTGANAGLALIQDGAITTDAANIILAGAGSDISTGYPLQTIESSLNSIAVGGTLQNIDGRTYNTANTITDSGIILLAGTLEAAAISVALGGLLEGSGILDAPVRNDGTINATGTLILADAVTGNGIIDIGGDVIVNGSMAAGETFDFLGDSGTLALSDPAQFGPNGFGSLTAGISGLQAGDVLALAGTVVSAISFGADSLSVTTSSGVYDFTDVTYGGAINGYSAAVDAGTGLEAITFTDTPAVPPVIVATGKTANYQVIGNGGSELVAAGGTVNITNVAAGGVQEVLPGGTVNFTVLEGGVLGVAGTANRAQVESGGYEVVQPGGKSVDTSVFSGAYEYVLGGATAIDSIIDYHGTVLVSAGGNASGSVHFAGSDAVLSVGGTVMPSATIAGFDQRNTHDDAIILTGFTYAAGQDTATLGAGGALTLDLNGAIEKLDFDPAQSNAGHSFAVTTNSLDQVVIIDPATGTKPNMAFLAPATVAGGADIVAQITNRSAALLMHISNTGGTSAGFQTALNNFAAIDTLGVSGAMSNLMSQTLPGIALSVYKFNAHVA